MATIFAQRFDDAPPAPSGKATPTRRCIASGELHVKSELLRFVVGPDGQVVLDLAGKLPGRGLWLLPRRDMLNKACARNLFARAAKAPVTVPADLAEHVVRAQRDRCLDLIGLARRAGLVAAGYEKVRSRLAGHRAGVLVQAVDASPGGRRKLSGLARAAVPVVEAFTAEELGRTLGREAIVHVALAPGPLTDRFVVEVARLAAVVGGGDDDGRT